ncbi:TonB-dependent receptor domain-containing protein [Methylotuvimicrobium sp. KM1]|uniref:TonB-dependent receptor domain-containing protein n=1 Tax=Methylotuvimicrobium sp. KM1 TaxID=3377707 RepID=UPI00384AF401
MNFFSKKSVWTVWSLCLSLILFPLCAQAHTEDIDSSGWISGFSHPLEGWDHLFTMLAVGIWAAQLKSNSVWQLPLAFVGVMSLGGLFGVTGFNVPGVEPMILLSVAVFGVLVLRRIRVPAFASLSVVMFFAFFHGYAHGQEMPASAGLLSFAFGFVTATLLLHGTGIIIVRLAVLAFASLFGTSVHAQMISDDDGSVSDIESETIHLELLPKMVVTERGDSLVGIADSASQGNIGQEQLQYRPIIRPGEILETVPGLIASQHSGEGKSNQFFLRGFNLDHGTDFLTKIDGVPVNLVSHAHGQGWTDTNFLIPELISTIRYQKGNYYAENGDFSSAGAADIRYANALPGHIARFTGGIFDYYRGLSAGSHKLGNGNLLYGGEIVHNGGPWTVSNDYLKFNGVLRYSEEYESSGWSVTAMAYKADWDATDQIPRRAVDSGTIGRFGTLDSTDGGSSRRYSLTGEWHRQDSASASELTVYGIYHELDLYSNFTYFLENPGRGDQFAQPDRRWTSGLNASHTFFHKIGSFDSDSTIGLQVRNDSIRNGLLLTEARQRWDTVRSDDVRVTNVSPYFENKIRWTSWLRTQLGVRFDGFQFDVSDSNRAENKGTRTDGIISPKAGIVFGPWADTEFYLNGGLGFHSNDARGVNQRVDPASGDTIDGDGNPVNRAVPLVRTYGAEAGLRTTWLEGLQSTLSVWWLDIDSELLFVGDAGTTEASRPSRRFGVEWANYYSPTDWLTFDADFSFSKARFRGNDSAGNRIPGAIESVIATGATVHDIFGGFFGGPRLRYFGPRPLIEDNSVRSGSTVLLSAMLGYRFDKTWTVQAEVFNILDRKDSAIDYYYESQLRGEADPVEDIHFHPVEPVSFRMSVTANF